MKRDVLLVGLALIFTIFVACSIQVVNNKRVSVQGTVVDLDGDPIPNIKIRTEVDGQQNEILGESVTDNLGNFKYVSLETEFSGLQFSVNADFFPTTTYTNPQYTGKIILRNTYFDGILTYDLGTIQLKNTGTLNLQFNNLPGDTNTISYSLRFPSTICQYSLGVDSEEECFEQFLNGSFEADDENEIIILNSGIGENVMLSINLNSEDQQTIIIPLTNTENTYVVEY